MHTHMEVERSSETSGDFHWITWCYVSENITLYRQSQMEQQRLHIEC
jgi:hypothetical protein